MVRVIFLHPDLGIGGAERLIVDAALALKRRQHSVSIYTTHHDDGHCFPETRDGTLDVHCHFDWLPRSVFGRLMALCAYVRMICLAVYLRWCLKLTWDVVVVDQVSACVPFLVTRDSKVLFYCHYPDQLLTRRRSTLKKIYRYFLDWFEESSTSHADKVLVNSLFTASVFAATFRSISTQPAVLYPSLDFSKFDAYQDKSLSQLAGITDDYDVLFLSINRFERKKNLALALHAFHFLVDKQIKCTLNDKKDYEIVGDGVNKSPAKVHLVMAGGYDTRNIENIQHYNELLQLCSDLGLEKHVTFLKSPSEECKVNLLRRSDCLVYTPHGEHFGIVPLESMYCHTPVVAVNSGGPMETIRNNITGFLCPQNPRQFSEAMSNFVTDRKLSLVMGEAGHDRVVQKFSFETFTNELDRIVLNLVDKKVH